MDGYSLEEIITIISFPRSTKFSFSNKHLIEQIDPDLSGATLIRNTLPKHFTAMEIHAPPQTQCKSPKNTQVFQMLLCAPESLHHMPLGKSGREN